MSEFEELEARYEDNEEFEVEYPEGRIPGCNDRKSQPGDLFPMAAEKVTLIDPADYAKYSGKLSLRPLVTSVFDQNGAGSCATESSTGGVKIVRAGMGLPFVELNPWFIYHHTSGGVDRGSSIDENLEFLQKFGVAPASVWPRKNGWRAKPSQDAYDAALDFRVDEVFDVSTVQEFISCLVAGFAVVWGAKGHSVLKVEHRDKAGVDLNSWDVTWGDNGFGAWAPYSQINWAYGAFAIRVVKGLI